MSTGDGTGMQRGGPTTYEFNIRKPTGRLSESPQTTSLPAGEGCTQGTRDVGTVAPTACDEGTVARAGRGELQPDDMGRPSRLGSRDIVRQ